MNTLEGALSSRGGRGLAYGVFGAVTLATLIAIPFAKMPLPHSQTLVIIYLTLACVADVLTAFLFVMQGRIAGSTPLLILGAGYLYSALTIGLHMLTFPGIFAPAGLIGADTQSTVWFWVTWHGGFSLFILAYAVVTKKTEDRPEVNGGSQRKLIALTGLVFCVVTVLAVIILEWDRNLPILFVQGQYRLLVSSGIGPAVLASIAISLGALIICTRLRRVIDTWLAVALFASLADCSLTLIGTARYTLGWDLARIESLFASTIVLLTFLRGIDAVLRRLSKLATLDGLTGLANRRAFDDTLRNALALGARVEKPVSLLLFDVDHFKAYNDTYGHPAGDETLRIVSDCIARSLKCKTDFAARYGGEEFVVILPAMDVFTATRVAERIRLTVFHSQVKHRKSAHKFVSVSCGIASLSSVEMRDPKAFTRILSLADKALYRSKEDGRNCITQATTSAKGTDRSTRVQSPVRA